MKRLMSLKLFALLLLLSSACVTKNPVAGKYSGLYELVLKDGVACHFLMKKDALSLPTVLCHDATQAWVVPIQDLVENVWATAPVVTESGTLLAFLDNKKIEKLSLLVSTDQGRNWDIFPSFTKKNVADEVSTVEISKKGNLELTFKSNQSKSYKAKPEGSLKSKFTPVLSVAKSYPEHCFTQHSLGEDAAIPADCLSGYLKRLLK
ncbi:MAG: hypothetical protein R3A80_01730 [Bdellovibrionota bacterium]